MNEKMLKEVITTTSNEHKDATHYEALVIVTMYSPYNTIPKIEGENRKEQLRRQEKALKKEVTYRFGQVASDYINAKGSTSNAFSLYDLFRMDYGINCAHTMVKMMLHAHEHVKDGIINMPRSEVCKNLLGLIRDDDLDAMDKLEDYYVIVLRWDDKNYTSTFTAGYNVRQYIDDSLSGKNRPRRAYR